MISRPLTLTRRGLVSVALQATAISALTPLAVRAQEASPAASPQATPATGATGALAEMLALAPDVLAQPDHPWQLAQFGDMAIQLAVLGREQPSSTDDPAIEGWIPATQWIALPQSVTTRGIQPEYRELFGFDLFQVDQGLVVGEPPYLLTYLRGRFNEDALRLAWTDAGYQRRDEDGAEIFSLAEEPEVDLQNPVHQMVLAQFNNATILGDGTIAFAPSLDLMRDVLAVASGQEPSLAAHDQVSALLSTVDQPLASALILDGGPVVGFDPRMTPKEVEEMLAKLEQSGEMPPARLALFGVTPGGPIPPPPSEPRATPEAVDNPAIYVIRLLMASAASAETAAETIPRRIETLESTAREGTPYTDLITVRRVEAVSDPPVVALDLDFVETPGIWLNLIFNRDLLFLAS